METPQRGNSLTITDIAVGLVLFVVVGAILGGLIAHNPIVALIAGLVVGLAYVNDQGVMGPVAATPAVIYKYVVHTTLVAGVLLIVSVAALQLSGYGFEPLLNQILPAALVLIGAAVTAFRRRFR